MPTRRRRCQPRSRKTLPDYPQLFRRLVRVLALSPLLITLHDTVANSQIGSVVMSGNSVMHIKKNSTDILVANDAANCLAVSVAFTH